MVIGKSAEGESGANALLAYNRYNPYFSACNIFL